LEDRLSKATLRQISRVILAMTGRVTGLELSRWAEVGGSYRSCSAILCAQVFWQVMKA
jgi:hypothetical protein